ncbi:MAG: tRNA lysidine(34) synthetase TilS [Desulfuromonadaceae bacterium]|nr:tRNA lysidine(34) synthetase TilS [Desulfuromonadaceae bacterium]
MTSSDASLISRVERTVRQQRLFRPGDTLVVALSGGADSSALLDLLSRLPDYNLRLIVAHLNHCLRGAESDADAEFCRMAASHYCIPFEVRRVDVTGMAADGGLNLEDAGRRARIQFLGEVRSRYDAAAVVLGHHADDQAETVLMRLLRGSGMTGLSGMTFRNAYGFVRPLLEISRPEIEQYLVGLGLNWREDASNSDTMYLRNRVRHQLLPLLEEYNPAIRSCLASTASILSGDEELLAELAEQAFTEACRTVDGAVVCSVAQIRTLNIALRRRVLRHGFKQLAGSLDGVSQRHIDAICDLIDSERPNSRLALPQAVTAVREYDRIVLKRTDGADPETGFELLITEPGFYNLPSGGTITVDSTGTASFSTDSCSVCLDPARIPFPWQVRTFRFGDRMVPFGMSGRKKVKDIFIDRKIPYSERRCIPLLFCGDDLIWIAGVCASELSRIVAPSATSVRVTWHV